MAAGGVIALTIRMAQVLVLLQLSHAKIEVGVIHIIRDHLLLWLMHDGPGAGYIHRSDSVV